MKKFLAIFTTLLAMAVLVSPFNESQKTFAKEQLVQMKQFNYQAENEDDHPQVDLEKGIEAVQYLVKKLKGKVSTSPEEIEKINKLTVSIEENWDMIEKQVEQRYPDDYHNIEDSLYPLIAIGKQTNPDMNKLKTRIKEVTSKLDEFSEKISDQ